jgi:hypothetical protein
VLVSSGVASKSVVSTRAESLGVGWEDGVVTARALSAALRAGRGIVGVGSGWNLMGVGG